MDKVKHPYRQRVERILGRFGHGRKIIRVNHNVSDIQGMAPIQYGGGVGSGTQPNPNIDSEVIIPDHANFVDLGNGYQKVIF